LLGGIRDVGPGFRGKLIAVCGGDFCSLAQVGDYGRPVPLQEFGCESGDLGPIIFHKQPPASPLLGWTFSNYNPLYFLTGDIFSEAVRSRDEMIRFMPAGRRPVRFGQKRRGHESLLGSNQVKTSG
jgi:hypothetical protein